MRRRNSEEWNPARSALVGAQPPLNTEVGSLTARSICTGGSHVTTPPRPPCSFPIYYWGRPGEASPGCEGYDSHQSENPCNTTRHIKMEISTPAGSSASHNKPTWYIAPTGTDRLHRNSTNPTEKSKKVKLSLCLIKHYAIKTYGGVEA
jgi:hypothetical protein